jgi:putative ABC transport system permease protein
MGSYFSTLWRHKIVVLLIVVEVAVASCLVLNAVSVFLSKLGPMYWPTGISDPSKLYLVRPDTLATTLLGHPSNTTAEDLLALNDVSSDKSASEVNTLPLLQEQWTIDVAGNQHKPIESAVIAGTDGFLKTLGLRVVAGRSFELADSSNYSLATSQTVSPTVIISARLAQKLWPNESPLWRVLSYGNNQEFHATVIGVVEHVIKPTPGDAEGSEDVIFEQVSPFADGIYAFRSESKDAASILIDATSALKKIDPNRSFNVSETFEELHSQYFEADRSLNYLLVFMMATLMLVCWLGVGSLSTFWIRQRYLSIGIRRALGATRRDIWHQFIGENFVLVSIGLIVGIAMSLIIDQWLIATYSIPPLNFKCVPLVALGFYLSCIAAIARTIFRAASVPPVVAVRS